MTLILSGNESLHQTRHETKVEWRREDHRGRRPAVWVPGEYLVIDWGTLGGIKVFCAVLARSRERFVRFAADEQATTTMAMLAECFEAGSRARSSRTG